MTAKSTPARKVLRRPPVIQKCAILTMRDRVEQKAKSEQYDQDRPASSTPPARRIGAGRDNWHISFLVHVLNSQTIDGQHAEQRE